MKNPRLHLVLLALFGLSALTVDAAQLASAKVLSVSGSVSSHSEDGVERQLIVGAILTQGDSVVTSSLSNALLVFSNGSEIVVEENTSILLAELSQEAFSGKKSYEQLQADPSKSQSLLELNYGKVSGHVKSLKPGSRFDIETPLGTAAIRGTTFTVEFSYNAVRGEFTLIIRNNDGQIDLVSRFAGTINYAAGSSADVGYDGSATGEDTTNAIPPAHVIHIHLSENDPNYGRIINALINYPPYQNEGSTPAIIVITPEDENIQITSPNTPE